MMKRGLMLKLCVVSVVYLLFSLAAHAKTAVIAHRGYWKTVGSAQNSLTSLAEAQKLGIYGSETDVHITADGDIIINHDDSIQGHDINTSTKKELTQLKLSNGENLPTLKAYLIQTLKDKNTRLIIEIKNKKDTAIENRTVKAVVAMVKKMKAEKYIEYISFSLNACKELVKATSGIPIAYLAGKGALTPAALKQERISGLDYHFSILLKNPQWIAEAKTLGLTVNAWTVNDPKIIRQLIDMGVDYITTDEPVQAKELIK